LKPQPASPPQGLFGGLVYEILDGLPRLCEDMAANQETSMDRQGFGIREGEKTVELPAKTDAGVYFIGRIHTPWTDRKDCPKNAREANAVCTIEIDTRFRDGLKDVESCTHLVLLYWMDKAPRNLMLQVPGHSGVQHGTFALRSPARPNPIAMSVVKLLSVEDGKLSVVGADCLDGTPLLDIKPYFASADSVPEAVVGWHTHKD
jgi:tRNA-Thr(GGU) m(6)t(6)A37 methyltransferase TsaA